MKLDRNITTPRRGKYALIKLRNLRNLRRNILKHQLDSAMVPTSEIDFGDTPNSDFFVIRLKDKYAAPALLAYSLAARETDPEYADEIFRLAELAANHPNKKLPD